MRNPLRLIGQIPGFLLIFLTSLGRLLTDPEIAKTAFKNLQNQKMRRNLTLLGIVIGIASIITLMALGQGLNAEIERLFENLGLNTISIQAGEDFASSVFSRLRETDAALVSKIPHVEQAIPFYETTAIAKNGNSEASIFLIGVRPQDFAFLEDTGYVEMSEGRLLNEGDVASLVVYSNFVDTAFDQNVGLRQSIEIKGKKFKIVGISQQTDVSSGAFGVTNLAYTTDKALKTILGEKDPLEMVVIVSDKEHVDETRRRIEAELERDHNEKDFQVQSYESLLTQVLSIIGIVQFFVLAIAAISLLVGGIGIMNTMFMAVTERTREIGTMKAIGATDELIRSLFLAEAGIIGAIGGSIGIALGYLLAMIIGNVATQSGFNLPISPDPMLIAFGLGFSVVIGILSGWAPAEKAIRLDPVEAIRYE